ncbi:MAG: hypothetical protein HPY59_09105 [Anaerolineae bacterium]|nr:hypothetical protein [Anaerolineae bacterium]
MRHKLYAIPIFTLFAALLLAACGAAPSNAAPPPQTNTPDPCAPSQIGFEIKKINDQVRVFDDLTFVANLTDQKLLTQPIMEMQAVRRQLEKMDPPPCLEKLNASAISYMNMVINYLAHFMGGISQEQINAEIGASQSLRTAYEEERARLVGATYLPPPTRVPVTPPATNPGQDVTPVSNQPGDPPLQTPQVVLVTNPGSASINIRLEPSMTSAIVGYLQPNETAPAIGRTEDSLWIAIEPANSPFRYAWVYAETVQLNAPIEELPTPEPSATPAPSETPAP